MKLLDCGDLRNVFSVSLFYRRDFLIYLVHVTFSSWYDQNFSGYLLVDCCRDCVWSSLVTDPCEIFQPLSSLRDPFRIFILYLLVLIFVCVLQSTGTLSRINRLVSLELRNVLALKGIFQQYLVS